MATFWLGTIAGLCAWLLFFAGRWLRRRLWPTFNERVDGRFQPYKPHLPLTALTEEEKENLKEKFRREFSAKPNMVLELGEDKPLSEEEVEEALHIPRTPSSLRAPSSAATTPPADPLSIESTSSPSSSVRAHGTRAP